jgi:hypothetical protein
MIYLNVTRCIERLRIGTSGRVSTEKYLMLRNLTHGSMKHSQPPIRRRKGLVRAIRKQAGLR